MNPVPPRMRTREGLPCARTGPPRAVATAAAATSLETSRRLIRVMAPSLLVPGFFAAPHGPGSRVPGVATVFDPEQQPSAAADGLSGQGHQPRENPSPEPALTFGDSIVLMKRWPQQRIPA